MKYLQFSTGKPHPLAKYEKDLLLHYPRENGYCAATLDIVGQYIILLVTFPSPELELEGYPSDDLFVINWLTGEITVVSSSYKIYG